MRLRLYKYLKSAFQQRNPSCVHASTHALTALLTHTRRGELETFPIECRNPENPPCLVRTQPRLGHSLGHFCPSAETLLVSKARTLLPVYFHSKTSPAGMEALPGQGNQRRQRRGQDSALGCVREFSFHLETSASLARRRARAVADGVPGGRLSGGPRCAAPRHPLCFAKGQSFTQRLSISHVGRCLLGFFYLHFCYFFVARHVRLLKSTMRSGERGWMGRCRRKGD